MASSIPLPELSTVYKQVPDIVLSLFHFPDVVVLEFKRIPEEPYSLINSYPETSESKNCNVTPIKQAVQNVLASNQSTVVNEVLFDKVHTVTMNNHKRTLFTTIIHNTDDFGVIACMVILLSGSGDRELSEWNIETLNLVSKQVRDGISAIELQRQLIFKEKSETNISLARRLGHDLTNIIATSKLDLMTIKRYLDVDGLEQVKSRKRNQIFLGSLKGLLNNTRFLQEIVDIYRSFSFVKNPVYLNFNINQLIDEIVDVFQLAMSRNVIITKNYQKDLPECVVEERLLKLAVFNLLSNALEAESRDLNDIMQKTKIDITTRYFPDTDEAHVTIRDYGPGIRADDGHLLSESEMAKIFLPGYSTKTDEESEGLGLNWVWTIITEFHKGRIVPENCPDKGAQFTICLNRSLLAQKFSVHQFMRGDESPR
jgi:signal transduction histidine kinase